MKNYSTITTPELEAEEKRLVGLLQFYRAAEAPQYGLETDARRAAELAIKTVRQELKHRNTTPTQTAQLAPILPRSD